MMFEAWSMVFEARSMMLDVVFAPKQRKLKKNDYLKINSPWNHMKPATQQVGANYHMYLPKYLI